MPTKNSHAPWNKLRQSPRDWRVVRWLRKKPVPATVVGETEDGDSITVKLVGRVGERPHWADATLALHECVKLTAYDDDKNILRVLTHDDDDPELLAEAQREEARRAGGVPEFGSSPLLAIDVPRLVKEIAESMERVAKTSAEAQSNSQRDAMKYMSNALDVQQRLMARLEAKLAEYEDAQPETSAATDEQDTLGIAALQKALGNGGAGGMDLGAILKQIPAAQLQEIGALLMNGGGSTSNGGNHG